MRRKRWLTLALVLLVVVTLGEEAARARHRTTIPNNAVKILADHDPGLVLSGVVSAELTIPIETPVWNLAVPLNSYVTKGQIVGETDPSMLPNRAARSDGLRLSPDEARFAVAQARQDVQQAENDLEAARAGETDAELQQVLGEDTEHATEQRYENAGVQFREGGMSAARHDDAVLAVGSAVAAAKAARSQAETSTSEVSDATARLREAQAGLADSERQWQLALSAAGGGQESGLVPVASPADGLLVARGASAGAFGICSDTCVLYVESRISEDDLLSVRVGQPAWISFDAEPQLNLRAKVTEIGTEPIDSPDGTVYAVTLSVDNPQGLLLSGTDVQVRISGADTGAE